MSKPMLIKLPSNKSKTPGKNGSSQISNSVSIKVSLPFIDKLSIVAKPPNDEVAAAIHSGIYSQFDDKSVFNSAKKLGGSNVVKLISLPGEVQRPHFSYKHSEGKAKYLRLEFNPRKLGQNGLSKLHSVLISLVPDGWEFFIENGKITRIDLAVNVVGVRMDEFLFLPATGLISKHWTKDGFLETITIGLPQGNQTLVYAKKKQRLAKKQPFLGPSTIRVERVLRKPSPCKLLELGVLANPFAHMTLLPTLPQPPSDEKEWQWSMFKDSVKVRGLVNALKLLPENRRKKYRDHLKTQGVSWWDPQAIWKHWQQAYSWLCEPNPLPSSTLSTLSPSDHK